MSVQIYRACPNLCVLIGVQWEDWLSFSVIIESLYDDPENTYGYFNFLSNALEALDKDDDLVITPEVDAYTDDKNFDDGSPNVESFPQETSYGRYSTQVMTNYLVKSKHDWKKLKKNLQRALQRKTHLDFNSTGKRASCLWEVTRRWTEKWNNSELIERIEHFWNIPKIVEDETIYLVKQTKLYAMQHNRRNFSVFPSEMRTFFAILLSGYHQLP